MARTSVSGGAGGKSTPTKPKSGSRGRASATKSKSKVDEAAGAAARVGAEVEDGAYLDREAAADVLGVPVSVLNRLAQRHGLPRDAYPGREARYNQDDLKAWKAGNEDVLNRVRSDPDGLPPWLGFDGDEDSESIAESFEMLSEHLQQMVAAAGAQAPGAAVLAMLLLSGASSNAKSLRQTLDGPETKPGADAAVTEAASFASLTGKQYREAVNCVAKVDRENLFAKVLDIMRSRFRRAHRSLVHHPDYDAKALAG